MLRSIPNWKPQLQAPSLQLGLSFWGPWRPFRLLETAVGSERRIYGPHGGIIERLGQIDARNLSTQERTQLTDFQWRLRSCNSCEFSHAFLQCNGLRRSLRLAILLALNVSVGSTRGNDRRFAPLPRQHFTTAALMRNSSLADALFKLGLSAMDCDRKAPSGGKQASPSALPVRSGGLNPRTNFPFRRDRSVGHKALRRYHPG